MTPRRTRSATKEEATEDELQEVEELKDKQTVQNVEEESASKKAGETQEIGDKRKKSPLPEAANKATKAAESEQATKTHDKNDTEANATPEKVLQFLLSDAALEVCRPADELEDLSKRGKDITTYAQLLSPFEELLCAVVLSRPISHRLGLRTIRTILNPPYKFTDVETIKAAGAENIHQALDDARTQHKGKTTEEIELIAEVVANNDWHNDLQKLREQTQNTVQEEREVLQSSIKGLGKTGLDIFYRRIQWLWTEAFPFVDVRTQDSLGKLGLPKKADEVVALLKRHWPGVKFDDGAAGDEEEKKRRAFVLLLERSVGADLENRIDDVLTKAARS
ncbi:endonuclease iii-like protein [Stagonosporopsis vannaccii]|nr:endonuclease iii-like protein [Stagonosporopsis vannaccii]